MTADQIAKMIGYSKKAVMNAAKVAGVHANPNTDRRQPKMFSEKAITKIIETLGLNPKDYYGKG